MKTKYIYIIIFIASTLISSCSEDFLNRQPLDQEVASNFYQTKDQAVQAIVAVYDVLGYQSVGDWAPLFTTSDMLSDDAFAGGGDANDGQNEDELNNFNIPTTSGIAHSVWNKNYIGIYRANLFLEKIEGIDASDEFKKRTIAEAKFLRAYFNFEQVRFFENIPLLTATISGPSEYSQTQNTPKEVYDQIALDLVEAAVDLPENLPTDELGRITTWAAQALLARVYLFYNGVYGADLDADGTTVDRNTALLYLEDVIANSGHDLLPNYDSIFHIPAEFGVESVFEISHGAGPFWGDWGYVQGNEGNLGAQMQGPRAKGGSGEYTRGWSFAPVSHKLYTDMAGDPRLTSTILTEQEISDLGLGLDVGYQHTGYYSKKYSSDNEHLGIGQLELNRTCNFRVIRYSDVLLMAAELGSANAQMYFDFVRDRAYGGAGLAPALPVNLDNIYNERRMEFALEGIRYWDVLRRGQSYAAQELSVSGVRGPNYIGDQKIFDVTYNTATKGFFPIPQAEIDLANGAFIQNDGY